MRWVLLVIASVGSQANAEETLAILPGSISLSGMESRQRIVVERQRDGQAVGWAKEAVLESSDPAVVRIEEGLAIPVADGKATLTARLGERIAHAEVHVSQMHEPFHWNFRNHVQSVLVKMGCNSGACHGAAAGKKGFRLSLRGYDAIGDFDVLVRAAQGRRVCPDEPAKSLMLLKPTGAIPHGGGVRFDVGSREYRVIADWIADGLTPPKDSDPRIERIEILPEHVTLSPGAEQPLLVQAYFSDGRIEDVTRWAKLASTNAEVADVSADAVVKTIGQGEAAVTAWYLNKIAIANVTAPYEQTVDPAVFAGSQRDFIDEIVNEKLFELQLPPSGRCTDEEFLRRAFLDTIGTLPTADELRSFLSDRSADKRDRQIESLLSRPEFVDYWSYKWSDLLLVNSERLRPAAMWSYYHWIREAVSGNRPWDEMVRDLLTARGSTLENGATNFYVLHQDSRELAETVSVAFLGLSINCARCHNHPMERWTNDEYFGFANLVSRVRIKNAAGEGNFVVFAAREGDLVQPLRGAPQPPRPLDGEALTLDAPEDRRVALAAWVTSPDNPYFAKAIVNRVWANFLGVGLVEAVDDLRLTNPPSNPKLLDALSRYLVEQRYDLKSLMRVILQSETYQRSSHPLPENAGDKRFYSRYYPRRLMAEVLMDAVSQVTAIPTKFEGYPEAWRAIQLPDSNVASYFLDRFGRPRRDVTCECERTNAPNMVQALHIANGDLLNDKLRQPGGRVDQWLASGLAPDLLIEEIFLVASCREPSAHEKAALATELAAAERDKRAWIEDLLWSILSSKEFLFNH